MLKQRAGIDVVHIAYRSGAPAMRALVGGEVDFTFTGMLTALPHVRAGRIRPLAVTSLKRSAVLPDVITMDAIYPGFESANWYAMFAPTGTPETIVAKLNSEIARAVKTREIRDFMESEGAEPVGGTPQDLAAFFRREVERYAKVIRGANIRADQGASAPGSEPHENEGAPTVLLRYLPSSTFQQAREGTRRFSPSVGGSSGGTASWSSNRRETSASPARRKSPGE
jgi:hypothetical protein